MLLPSSADVLVHRAARSVVEPYAVFAFDQPDFEGGSFPMYTVHGGPNDRSSVTAETLRMLGIPIVEVA